MRRDDYRRSAKQSRKERRRFLRRKNNEEPPRNPNPQVCMGPSGSRFSSTFGPLLDFIHATLVSVAVRDEFSGMETVMNSVMEAVGGKSSRRVSPLAKPSKIIPGAQTFEDLEAFLKRKKDAKLEELKKKK